MKTCSKCGEAKSVEEFYSYRDKYGKERPSGRCKRCQIHRDPEAKKRHLEAMKRYWRAMPPEKKAKRKEWEKNWRTENKSRIRPIQRRASMKSLYGVTPDRYRAMLVEQNYSCAMCFAVHDPDSRHGVLHVDHDHSTGEIRGLLCRRCNSSLGLAGDDPAKAAEMFYRYAVKCTPLKMVG